MDEATCTIKSNDCPWESETIPEDSVFYRLIDNQKRKEDPDKKRKFPGPDHFALRSDIGEDSLSMNWDRYAEPKTNFILYGIRHGRDGSFQEYSGQVLFKYPYKILKNLPHFEKITHSAEWNGNPSPVGAPNNRSHVSLYCGVFPVATRAMLSLYCQKDTNSSIDIKMKLFREEIDQLRSRANNTPYHRDWVFDQ